jgi:hypothetical protein
MKEALCEWPAVSGPLPSALLGVSPHLPFFSSKFLSFSATQIAKTSAKPLS